MHAYPGHITVCMCIDCNNFARSAYYFFLQALENNQCIENADYILYFNSLNK